MPKTVGFVLLIFASVWLFYCLAAEAMAIHAGVRGTGDAAGHLLLTGVLPFLLVAGIAGVLLFYWRKHEVELKTFEYEQQILTMLHKDGRVSLKAIQEAISVDPQQIRELLISMGEKRLFTGYIDWKEGQMVSGEVADISPGECPVCDSLTATGEPHMAVCTRCGARIFLPSPVSRGRAGPDSSSSP